MPLFSAWAANALAVLQAQGGEQQVPNGAEGVLSVLRLLQVRAFVAHPSCEVYC